MASESATKSRLSQMQMRFQQKQLVDREQRRKELVKETKGDFNEAGVTENNIRNGKVRQMFDERRRGAGIDRSNPLKPITTPGTISTKPSVNFTTISTQKRVGPFATKKSTSQTVTAIGSGPRLINGRKVPNARSHSVDPFGVNGNIINSHQLDDETFPSEFSSLSLKNDVDQRNNNEIKSKLTNGNHKLNPVILKKSPQLRSTRPPTIRPATPTSSVANRSPIKSVTPTSTSKPIKTPMRNSAGTPPFKDTRKRVSNSTPPPGTRTCGLCKRHFAEDRLEKHQEVCQKTATKRRKVFDASKHRLQGTDAEKYVRKVNNRNVNVVNVKTITSNGGTPKVKNNWRQKHEEFIATIRAAKEMQVYLSKGGKLKDLPPPPPSENPDYIQCPHCLRRFNQAAAERHIPKCANMLHNKPKPAAARKR